LNINPYNTENSKAHPLDWPCWPEKKKSKRTSYAAVC
jgi:hypothetical protein